MDFLASTLLGRIHDAIHGFGQRVPGTREAARESAGRTFAAAGEVFFLKQVHGCAVVRPPWSGPPEADVSVTETPGQLLAIETADCLPLLIADPVARRVAAVHAGWRGTAAGVSRAAVSALVASGSKPGDLFVALGPAIGPCCYEVGRDVEQAFGPEGARYFVPGRAERKHLDLADANRDQLIEMGVRPDRIDALNLCTRCRGDLFFSYRRDSAEAGRMISVIGLLKPAAWPALRS